MNIALIAHDEKKELMVQFCIASSTSLPVVPVAQIIFLLRIPQ